MMNIFSRIFNRRISGKSDLSSTPLDQKEMEQVGWAMLQAWKDGNDFMVPSRETYFRNVVPLLDIHDAVRIGVGQRKQVTDGSAFMVDNYRLPNGRIVCVGYKLKE